MIDSISKMDLSKLWKIILCIINALYHHSIWIYRSIVSKGRSDNLTCLAGKTAIVTGGNAGIGYGTSMLLASRGCKVIIACRREAIEERDKIIKETNNPNVFVRRLDLSQLESVRQFASQIKQEEKKIDILINNAAIGFSDGPLTEDGLERVMQTNYFGHFLLTHLLIDLLKSAEDARIVFLTSSLSMETYISVEKLYPTTPPTVMSRWLAYPNSKLCAILAAKVMAEKLENFGITVNSADPGVSATHIYDPLEGQRGRSLFIKYFLKMGVKLFGLDVFGAAQTSFHLAASKNVGNGLLYYRCAPIGQPWMLKDKDLCQKIWKETEKIVKLRPEEKL